MITKSFHPIGCYQENNKSDTISNNEAGEELVTQGIADLIEGRETVAALVVMIGAPRLRRIGLAIPQSTLPSPEHRLYEHLKAIDPDSAHSRYNALIRRLVSFERAAERALPENLKKWLSKTRISHFT